MYVDFQTRIKIQIGKLILFFIAISFNQRPFNLSIITFESIKMLIVFIVVSHHSQEDSATLIIKLLTNLTSAFTNYFIRNSSKN